MSKQQDAKDLQVELLNEKLKSLESKVIKPQTAEEAFQARVALYEAKQEERNKLAEKIQSRRNELMMQNYKLRQDEAAIIEAWERRAKENEVKNPDFAKMLKARIAEKLKEINSDSFR